MQRDHGESGDTLGIALVGAIAFGAGLLLGLISGGLIGEVDPNRLRRAVRGRMQPDEGEDQFKAEPHQIEHNLIDTLENNPATRGLNLEVRALGGGLVEITGVAPDQTTREVAGDLARSVLGSAVVVNRVLVEGTDTNGRSSTTSQ